MSIYSPDPTTPLGAGGTTLEESGVSMLARSYSGVSELPLLLFLFPLLKIIQTFITKIRSNNVTKKFLSSSEFDCSTLT